MNFAYQSFTLQQQSFSNDSQFVHRNTLLPTPPSNSRKLVLHFEFSTPTLQIIQYAVQQGPNILMRQTEQVIDLRMCQALFFQAQQQEYIFQLVCKSFRSTASTKQKGKHKRNLSSNTLVVDVSSPSENQDSSASILIVHEFSTTNEDIFLQWLSMITVSQKLLQQQSSQSAPLKLFHTPTKLWSQREEKITFVLPNMSTTARNSKQFSPIQISPSGLSKAVRSSSPLEASPVLAVGSLSSSSFSSSMSNLKHTATNTNSSLDSNSFSSSSPHLSQYESLKSQNNSKTVVEFNKQFIEYVSSIMMKYIASTLYVKTSANPSKQTEKVKKVKKRDSISTVQTQINSQSLISIQLQEELSKQNPSLVQIYYCIIQSKVFQWLHTEFEKIEIHLYALEEQFENLEPIFMNLYETDDFLKTLFDATEKKLDMERLDRVVQMFLKNSKEQIDDLKKNEESEVKRESFLLLLYVLSYLQKQFIELKQQFILEKSKQILVELLEQVVNETNLQKTDSVNIINDTLQSLHYFSMNHHEFSGFLQTHFEVQERVVSIKEQIEKIETYASQFYFHLKESILVQFTNWNNLSKKYFQNLKKEQIQLLEESVQIEQHEKSLMVHTDDSKLAKENNIAKRLIEISLGIVEIKMKLAESKIDFLQTKIDLFEEADGTFGVRKNSSLMAPLKQQVHLLHLSTDQLLQVLQREILSHVEFQLASLVVSLKQKCLQQFTLVNENTQLFINKLSHFAAMYSKRLKLLMAEKKDNKNERKNFEKLIQFQKSNSNNKNDPLIGSYENSLQAIRLNLDIIKKEIQLTTYHLEKIEQKQFKSSAWLKNQKQKKEQLINSVEELQLLRMNSAPQFDENMTTLNKLIQSNETKLFESSPTEDINWDEDLFFKVGAVKVYEEFVKHIQSDEQTIEIRSEIDRMKQQLPSSTVGTQEVDSSKHLTETQQLLLDIKSTKKLAARMLYEFISNKDIGSAALQQIELYVKCCSAKMTGTNKKSNVLESSFTIERLSEFIGNVTRLVIEERADFASQLEEDDVYKIIENLLFSIQDGKVYELAMKYCSKVAQDKKLYDYCIVKRKVLLQKLLNLKDVTDEYITQFSNQYKTALTLLRSAFSFEHGRSPTSKLSYITKSSKAAMETLNSLGNTALIAADDFLPLFISLIAICEVKDLCTELNFIKIFANESILQTSEFAYYAATFESAIFFLLNQSEETQKS